MFYIIIFSALAVLLVVAGLTVLSRRRTQLHAAESQASGPRRGYGRPARRKRKSERAQSRHDRRKRH